MATTSISQPSIMAWTDRLSDDPLGWLVDDLLVDSPVYPEPTSHTQGHEGTVQLDNCTSVDPQLLRQPVNHSPNLLSNSRMENLLSQTYPSSGQNSPRPHISTPMGTSLSPVRSTMLEASPSINTASVSSPQHLRSSDTSFKFCVQRPTGIFDDSNDKPASTLVGLDRSIGKGGHIGDHSKMLLSPRLDDTQYEADCASSITSTNSPLASQHDYFPSPQLPTENLVDLATPHQHGGIAPDARQKLNREEIMSPNEQERARCLSEMKLDVYEWLSTSDVGSDVEGQRRSRVRKTGRPRSMSKHNGLLSEASVAIFPSLNSVPQTIIVTQNEVEAAESESFSDVGSPPVKLPEEPTIEDDATSSCPSRPWADPEPVTNAMCTNERCQPATSNAAMKRFQDRAKEVDNASLAPTIGSGRSRRRSESDLASICNETVRHPVTGMSLPRPSSSQRRTGLLGSFSSKLKRKNSSREATPNAVLDLTLAPDLVAGQDQNDRLIAANNMANTPTLTLNTNISNLTPEPKSPLARGLDQVRQIARRARSRSDIRRSPQISPGLAELWRGNGGPPVATLGTTTPSQQTSSNRGPVATRAHDSEDEAEPAADGQSSELAIRTDIQLDPSSRDGFLYHAKMLNQTAPPRLLARVVDEQIRRYQYMTKLSGDHARTIQHRGICPNGDLCRSLHPNSYELLEPKTSNHNSESTAAIFYISYTATPQDPALARDTSNVQATFPKGIPLPPVPRLPARFECPLCFKVKDFQKPSDWTKHVHEDLQPFTCTFSECDESKSFKRKADWVRHENEGHRHLESWQCKGAFGGEECSHICYRKDNFVQHLVREHKVPEPKVRTGRVAAKSPVNRAIETLNMTEDDVWKLVEECRSESAKNANSEPCRFCGQVFPNFKKLTVHLSQHLLQLSLPILQVLGHSISGVAGPAPTSNHMVMARPLTAVPSFTSSPTATESMFSGDAFANSPYAISMAPYNQSFPPVPTALTVQNPTVYAGAPINGRQTSISLPGSLHSPLRQRASSYGGQPSANMQFHDATYPPPQMATQHLQLPNASPYLVPWQVLVPTQQRSPNFPATTMGSSPASQPGDDQTFNTPGFPFHQPFQ